MPIDTRQIQAIVFDAYGTLLDVSSIDAYLINTFGEDKATEIAKHWRQKQLEYTWLRSLMHQYVDFYTLTEHALLYALKATDTAAETSIIRDTMSQYYHLKVYDDISPTLARLFEKYKLGILSNANPSLLEKAAAYNNIDPYLSKILSADTLGQYKPAPSVYQLAEKAFQLQSSEILFISSNTWDIAGASAYGLQTCWLNRQNGLLEELDQQVNLEINTLNELTLVLG